MANFADGAGRLLGESRPARGSGGRDQGAAGEDRRARYEIFCPRPSVGEPRPESRDGSHPRPAQHRPAVPLGLGRTLVVLLREPAPAAGDRRAVFGDAVLRLAADDQGDTVSRQSIPLLPSADHATEPRVVRNRPFSASTSVTDRFTGTDGTVRGREPPGTAQPDPIPQARIRNAQSLWRPCCPQSTR